MKTRSHEIVVIIPALNEEAAVAGVISGALRSLPEADIVVIDDGSRDATAKIARKAGAVALRLPLNCGYGVALQTGYKYAKSRGYRYILQMDADGQHEPACLPHILRALKDDGSDVVIGSRFLNSESYEPTPIRRIGMRFFALLTSMILRQRITDPTSGFVGMRDTVIPFLISDYFPGDYPDADVIIMRYKRGFTIREIPVKMHPSQTGSMHRGIRPLYYIYKMLLSIFVSMTVRKSDRQRYKDDRLRQRGLSNTNKVVLDFLHISSIPMSSFIMNIGAAIKGMGHDVFLLTKAGSLNERLAQYHGFQTVTTLDKWGSDIAFVDNGRLPNQRDILAHHRCRDIVYFEFGYLEHTIQVDRKGVNADASFNVENRVLFAIRRFKNWQRYTDLVKIKSYPVDWRVAGAWLAQNPGFIGNMARYISREGLMRLTFTDRPALPDKFFFIPMQVHNDTQIIHHSPYIRSMADILDLFHDKIVENFPGYSIVVKEHPYDSGILAYSRLRKRYPGVIWLRRYDFGELVDRCSVMITVNSSSGFKALAQYKKVLTLGECFYNKNGFIEHVPEPSLFVERLKTLMDRHIDHTAVDEYIRHFRQHIFVDGNISLYGDISHLTQKTIAQILCYMFEKER